MKNFILLYLIFFSLTASTAQTIEDKIAERVAKEILVSLDKLPQDKPVNIYIKSFLYKDTVQTYLSVKIIQLVDYKLGYMLEKKKKFHHIRLIHNDYVDKITNQSITKIFNPSADNEDFIQHYRNNLPDFFISGIFKLSGNTLTFDGIRIKPNDFSGRYRNYREINLPQIDIQLSENELKQIRALNYQLYNTDEFMSLINFRGDWNINATATLINSSTGESIKDIVYTGSMNHYKISIQLPEQAYVYAFTYDPSDRNFPYISVLIPDDNPFNAGKNLIPQYGYFYFIDFDPDNSKFVSQPFYIKIVISKFELTIPLSVKKIDGYEFDILDHSDSEKLTKILNSFKEDIYTIDLQYKKMVQE